jgi:hypothetical protein
LVNAFRKYAGPRCRAIALSQNPDGTGGMAVTISTFGSIAICDERR